MSEHKEMSVEQGVTELRSQIAALAKRLAQLETPSVLPPRVRKRSNMATSVKGIKTPDVTVESYEDTSYEEHMALYDKLVKDTQSRASATPVVADAAN